MIAIASCGHNCDDERIYHKQINTLITNQYQIQYFAYSNKTFIEDEYAENIQYRFFNSTEISQTQYKIIVFNLLKNNPPKIFHIHDMELLPVAYKLKKKHPNIKIIYDVHEDLEAMWDTFSSYPGFIKKIVNGILKRYEKQYLSCVDQFILANQFADSSKYELYGSCVVLENYPLLKNTQPLIENKVTQLIYHGQISDERGIDVLVKSFNILSKQNSNLELKIIGGFRKKEFQRTLNQLIDSNDKIQLIDSVEHNHIWDYLYSADIGIIPFKNVSLCQKNTPTKLFEYMQSGCAIVASDLKPISNFCRESASWATPGNSDSLVQAIEYYLNNNEKYMEHKKTNLNLITQSYNWESISDTLVNIYENLS